MKKGQNQIDACSGETIDHTPIGDPLLIQRMVDKAADMVFLLGPMGRIQYANEAASKALGYTREELQSMTVFELTRIHDTDNWREHEEELKKAGSMTFENVLKTKDGRLLPVEMCANYARLGDKEYNYSFSRDITERKQAERELEKYRKHLEDLVRERTRKLEDVNGQLQADIAERKRTEEALRESEGRYRELVENANSIILRTDRDGNITFFNEFAQQFFGYTEEEILGRNVMGAIIPATDSAGKDLAAMLDDLLRHPEDYRTNINQNMRKNGELVWVSWTNKAIYDDAGSLAGLMCIGNDITRLKQAEEAFRESEERFHGLFESSLDGIAITDIDGNIVKVNPAYHRMLGYSEEELLHISYKQLTPAIWHDMEARIIREQILLRGYSDEYEKEYIRKDGSVFPISIRVWLIKDDQGQPWGMWAIIRDITERKRAEEALKDSRAHLDSIFRAAPTGIGVVVDRVITEANDRLCEMTGYMREELLGKDARIFYTSDEDYEYVGREKYAQIERIGTGTMETRWRRRDGSLIDVLLSSTPLDPRNLHAGVTFTALDITERKWGENELKEAKLQAELYLDLMGHDMNNMHQVALGYLELARDTPPGEEQVEFMDKSAEVLQRSTKLIGNVRKLQKLHDGVFEVQDVDVCRVLADVQSEYAAVLGKKITLNLNGHGHCIVHANDLLHDVLSNLVNNAVKHTGDGTQIMVGLNVIEDNGRRYCHVIVEDNGPGIPDDSKEIIFNRMIKGTARGMGLGLYLVKTLVDSYGGRVWAEDRVKGDHSMGARFVVMLPAVEK